MAGGVDRVEARIHRRAVSGRQGIERVEQHPRAFAARRAPEIGGADHAGIARRDRQHGCGKPTRDVSPPEMVQRDHRTTQPIVA